MLITPVFVKVLPTVFALIVLILYISIGRIPIRANRMVRECFSQMLFLNSMTSNLRALVFYKATCRALKTLEVGSGVLLFPNVVLYSLTGLSGKLVSYSFIKPNLLLLLLLLSWVLAGF